MFFTFVKITLDEFRLASSKLKSLRIMRLDGLPCYMFNAFSDSFAIPLLYIFNLL